MYDVLIIGAGLAGLTAGLYTGRYRLNTVILEKFGAGGQILLSPTIENFPGFPGGIATADLVDRLRKQIDELGVEIEMDEVVSIEPQRQSGVFYYNVRAKNKAYQAKVMIIASGAQPKGLGIKGENELIGRGVSYCGTCDGPLFRNKEIVVVGGGDRAIEDAIFLSTYASRVTVVHRRQGLRAAGILEEKARANPKINFALDSVLEEIIGENRVEAVKIRNVKTDTCEKLPCSGVFIFVGIKPNTSFLVNYLKLDEAGFVVTDQEMKTSAEAIFACGDCRKKDLYQAINACAEGAVAAAAAHKYLL